MCIPLLGTVKYEVRLEDGTVVAESDGVEFTVKDGTILSIFEHLYYKVLKGQFLT